MLPISISISISIPIHSNPLKPTRCRGTKGSTLAKISLFTPTVNGLPRLSSCRFQKQNSNNELVQHSRFCSHYPFLSRSVFFFSFFSLCVPSLRRHHLRAMYCQPNPSVSHLGFVVSGGSPGLLCLQLVIAGLYAHLTVLSSLSVPADLMQIYPPRCGIHLPLSLQYQFLDS